jgi:prepilin-type N-terminal cleavage/methylation domain-containing protein
VDREQVMGPSVRCSPDPAGKGGFTLVELLIALTLIAVAMAISASAFRTYYERTLARRAASVIAADIAVTRSTAIKLGRNVSLVATEDSLSYVIRSDSGTVLYPRRSFDTESELPLTSLDVQLNGDSMTFNPRGIMVSGGARRIDVAVASRGMRVEFNVLGRTRIVQDGS